MNTTATSALPIPARTRWQALRLGLVELFRYDSEEFWFRDGHLLLRGNNGTGKSKVLSLTLPLLLDANLRSSRVEPDGDPGKKMVWNLLMGDAYERRTGYSWCEFGRVGEDGQPQFLTLGLGLHAVAARSHQIDSWYFIAEGPTRVGQGLALLSAQRQVLTRERLREALAEQGHGQVYDNAQSYRRAVDERLFQLGVRRYDALLDTLIQLRQPQLSRRPDERALSAALTEALPPLPQELLGDVAEAMTQLEDLRTELERTQRLHGAVQAFDQQYRLYAGIASRRQARGLRQAQTEFDNASRARHEAQAGLVATQALETAAKQRLEGALTMLAGARTRYETLLADPLNTDADRLQRAAADARHRERERDAARSEAQAADAQVQQEAALRDAAQARDTAARTALQQARHEALTLAAATGLQAALAAHPHAGADTAALLATEAATQDAERRALLALPARRRDDLLLVRRRLQTLAETQARLQPLQQALAERRADTEDAAAALAQAEDHAEAEGQAHLEAWANHLHGLKELQVDQADTLLDALAPWVLRPAQIEHPVRRALLAAQGSALARLAEARAALAQQRGTLQAEATALAEERAALRAGVDSGPAAPAWRGPATRAGQPGAPLWQLVDFQPDVPAAHRAGLEAALHAAGLLDAWVTPEGRLLQAAGGQPWPDAQWLPRPVRPVQALSQWLQADAKGSAGVSPQAVAALLAGIACGDEDDAAAEAWVARDGRFRLAGLAGAGTLAGDAATARHIGHAARQAAREARLAQIAHRLADIQAEQEALTRQETRLQARAAQATAEWQTAPSEQALLRAHQASDAALRGLSQARQREAEALQRSQQAEQAAQAAAQALARDAADLRLPGSAAGLDQVESELHRCTDAFHHLAASVRELRVAGPELQRQAQRAQQALQHQAERQAHLAERSTLAEQARAHADALESVIGPQVKSLKDRLERARGVVARLEGSEKRQGEVLRRATEARAVAEQQQQHSVAGLEQRAAARMAAVENLRLFTATGLLASGLAGSVAAQDLPEAQVPWTIDPALALARRVEQALTHLDDGEERWARAQQRVTEDLQLLQRALSALGENAAASTTDFGFVVHVQWRQRAERPETLAALLQAELLERGTLLSAREREVLENHLQAEIASQIQALLRAASQQVAAINTELQRRPTSTGVRFRLQWQSLPEGQGGGQGAPAGLHAARERLLHTNAALWAPADRQAFGALLQQRIADERQRADGEGGKNGDGSTLIDQLARALDYRQWHQFRVERWQDGSWRKLSGPASSGERALGLTVPLFAAVATFYGASPLAPRLILLDEAFAGIDDAARAHCMALVREFDLDFVITSEREWACYAELPGVAICQLQRREGIDAVHVSRWTWDGRVRRADAGPPRVNTAALRDETRAEAAAPEDAEPA
jgi:uncharacterized protein (TIGR02680 family)